MDATCPRCHSHDITVEPEYPHILGYEVWDTRAAQHVAYCNDCGTIFDPDANRPPPTEAA